ncbi:MAG: GNAT family N-acetyltransferase [Acidobacteria bacterium]|nr:GNAT family N-acetyltransferase [Acidobacteriota bacterium]
MRIERATERDVPLIFNLIKGLAEYEKLAHEVTATEEKLRATLFGPRPAAEVVIAYADDAPAGFALFFHNYSTFLGQPGIYLEDLYVVPEWRGHGLGRRLLTHLAKLAVERHCGRLEWSVLDWNAPAIGFYRGLGARLMQEWSIFRLTGDSLRALATDDVERRDR